MMVDLFCVVWVENLIESVLCICKFVYVVIIFNIVVLSFLCYIIVMMNIVIIYVLGKMLLILKFLKILFLSFVVFDFCIGLLSLLLNIVW